MEQKKRKGPWEGGQIWQASPEGRHQTSEVQRSVISKEGVSPEQLALQASNRVAHPVTPPVPTATKKVIKSSSMGEDTCPAQGNGTPVFPAGQRKASSTGIVVKRSRTTSSLHQLEVGGRFPERHWRRILASARREEAGMDAESLAQQITLLKKRVQQLEAEKRGMAVAMQQAKERTERSAGAKLALAEAMLTTAARQFKGRSEPLARSCNTAEEGVAACVSLEDEILHLREVNRILRTKCAVQRQANNRAKRDKTTATENQQELSNSIEQGETEQGEEDQAGGGHKATEVAKVPVDTKLKLVVAEDVRARKVIEHELEVARRCTRSAKLKAVKYKAALLDAKKALAKETQRCRSLEKKVQTLGDKLLASNRERVRVTTAARARSAMLGEERARQEKRAAEREAFRDLATRAAVCVQRVARGHIQRMSFQASMAGVRALQRAWRCQLERHRFQGWARECNARALRLQRLYRGRRTRKRLAWQARAVTMLQACIRGFLARKRIAPEIEDHLRSRRTAAVVLQSARRCQVVQQRFISLRKVAVMVQSRQRSKWSMREAQRRTVAVAVIQRAGCLLAFRAYRKRAAMVLQRSHRFAVERRKARDARWRLLAAAKTICGTVRLWDRRRRWHAQAVAYRQVQAAIMLQKSVRGHQSRRRYMRWQEAALVLQGAQRRWTSRAALKERICRRHSEVWERRAQEVAARVTIQGNILELPVRVPNHRRLGAVVAIQRVARGRRVRLTMARHHVAATNMARAFRGHATRERLRIQRPWGAAQQGLAPRVPQAGVQASAVWEDKTGGVLESALMELTYSVAVAITEQGGVGVRVGEAGNSSVKALGNALGMAETDPRLAAEVCQGLFRVHAALIMADPVMGGVRGRARETLSLPYHDLLCESSEGATGEARETLERGLVDALTQLDRALRW
ncbi:unnamed protein product [Discosporangium mesarthrocarpum]